jgi:anaerobic selenocysteine-containing dehydrogenase
MMSSHSAEAMAETLRKIPFIVSIDMFVNETEEFADIFLPEAHDFERWELFPANDPYAFITPGPGEWFWTMRQPVTPPPEEARPWNEVYLEIAERLGFLDELYEYGNDSWILGDAYKLDRGKTYTIRDIAERQAKTIIGDHFDWALLRETPTLVTREKTVEEAYPRPFMEGRAPIYFEYLLDAAKDLRSVIEQLGLPWDLDPYTPLPTFISCDALRADPEYDLISMNFKVPFHTFSISAENIWIDEISRANPYAYKVVMNSATARKKGLEEGIGVWVKSRHGKVYGNLRVTEAIHPECVGIAGTFGHWARKMPIAKGKGACYNDLLPPPSLERIDPISGQIDMCVKVKVYRR